MKSHRHRGMKRGEWWENESPTVYGIELLQERLPLEVKTAALYYQNNDAFAVYPDGDWFDGYHGGWAGVVFATELYKAANINNGCILLFDKVGGFYHLYTGSSNRVESWLELHCENRKPLPALFALPTDPIDTRKVIGGLHALQKELILTIKENYNVLG